MRILIVEHEPELQQAISIALQEQDCEVETANDLGPAFVSATGRDYDAWVIDAALPSGDGWNLLASLRSLKSTPALMLVTAESLEIQTRRLNTESEDFLIKPFQPSELLTRLFALTRRAHGRLPAVIEIGDARIDTVHRTVARAGKEVTLTEIEYSLIELLLQHRRELVSRSMIYQKIYEQNDDSLSARVDAHISNIRKKLGYRFITTRKGQGYVILD